MSTPRTTPPGLARRSWRWVRAQWLFLLVLVGLAGCFVYLVAEPRHPVRGTGAIGVVLIVAGLLRLAVPPTRVGMLAIRSRGIDTACYLVLGLLVIGTDLRLLRGV